MINLGNIVEDDTIYIPFNTYDRSGASVTVTDLVSTDVHIHKDGNTTQRSSASGITVSIDFDSIAGNHLIAIDLSDNTDAGFYATGADYQVRVEGITVDSQTINAWIGMFSIENRFDEVDVTKIGGVAQSATDLKDFADEGYDPITNKVQGVVLTDTCTTNTDLVSAVAVRTEMDSNSTELAKIGTIPALDGAGQTIGAAIAKLADDNGGANFDATNDSLERIANTAPLGTAMRGTDSAALASVCTEARLAELDAANLPADVDSILVDTGTDGVVVAAASKTGYALSTAGVDAVADQVWDETVNKVVHNSGQSAGKLLRLSSGSINGDGAVNDASPTTSSFITDLASSETDHYKDLSLVFTGGTLEGQSRVVSAYNGSTKLITLSEAFTTAPANGDDFVISVVHVHSIDDIADGIWDEAASGHVAAGTFGAQCGTDIDAILVDTADMQGSGVKLSTQGKADVNAEVVDVVSVDTISELSQAQPSATPTINQALMLWYMKFRNEFTQTSTTASVKNDAGTVITKATVSDDGTTYTKQKLVSGP